MANNCLVGMKQALQKSISESSDSLDSFLNDEDTNNPPKFSAGFHPKEVTCCFSCMRQFCLFICSLNWGKVDFFFFLSNLNYSKDIAIFKVAGNGFNLS